MRRALPLLLAVPLLAACGTTEGTGTAATTTTATTTATVTATASASAASSDVHLAARLAALACEGYVFSGTLDAASGSAPLAKAASTATSAALLDGSWTDLAGAVAFLSALPLTDVPADDQTRATAEVAVVQSRCADAGVTVR